MKKMCIVLKYELKEYFASKGFMALTLILAFAAIIILSLPRFIDMSNITGVRVVGKDAEEEQPGGEEVSETYLYLDKAGLLQEDILREVFSGVNWQEAKDEAELVEAVESRDAGAGFVVTGATEYDYYVYNKGMADSNTAVFDEVMRIIYRINYCAENNLDLTEISAMYNVPVTVNEQVLNKNTGSNYWYCYFLVIIVFFLITMYGQMIAVSVTSEKSNRAIEVLVTSTTPNSLLFGKVIAGAIGGLFQAGVILGSMLLSYRLNREQWGEILDMVLHIPGEVLLTFAVFGLGGYLFYAFLYGAMGALVSKTEDVSKSASGLMVMVMAVYFFSLIQLSNVEGMPVRILSFLPFSSYSTMFARIAMGTVTTWEILLSALILFLSIVGAGVLGAKLYRMGTLRYGNPIKLTTALKDLKKM